MEIVKALMLVAVCLGAVHCLFWYLKKREASQEEECREELIDLGYSQEQIDAFMSRSPISFLSVDEAISGNGGPLNDQEVAVLLDPVLSIK